MPWFPLHVTQVDYELTPGNVLTTFRHQLRVEVVGAITRRPFCFFDTGATFSVMSYSLAQALGAAVTPLAVGPSPIPMFENGVPVAPTSTAPLLTWWDALGQQLIPCVLAELFVRLRNANSNVTSDPLRMVAKVLRAPARAFNDQFVLLGTHLLTANAGRLHLDGQAWGLGGPGLFFPP
jgi:hypothetical protein